MLSMVGVLVGGGCGGSNPATPSSPYVGRWSGTATDDSAGAGAWEMTLTEAGSLSGTGTITVAGRSAAGPLAELPPPPGTSGRFMTLSCGSSQGALVFNLVAAGASMSGTFQSLGCPGFSGGSVRGQRQ